MQRGLFIGSLLGMLALTAPGSAQAPASANPFSGIAKAGWDNIKRHLSRSASLMPEAEYSFKPTPQVRTFGQLIGHLVNEHYVICSGVKGEKNPIAEDFEKKPGKAELVAALNESITYCDGVYGAMTDAKALEQVKLFGESYSRLAALTINVTHDSEHYGNVVTYLRLKGLVPPSTATSE